MTQPFPEPRHFDSEVGTDPSTTPDLLEGRLGIVAVLAAPEAHASGWASQAAVALAEASQAAGRPTSLMDLALDAPRLHKAAGVTVGEGLSDVILFGASPDRVSRWTPAGVRILTAGTPVGDSQELVTPESPEEDAGWMRAARAVVEGDGCVLAYVVADTPEAAAILEQVPDVILFRHEGEELAALSLAPSMVLEPQPVSVALPDVQVPDVQALNDGASNEEASLDDDSLEDVPLDDVLFDDPALETPSLEDAALEEVLGQDVVADEVEFEETPVEAVATEHAVSGEEVVALDLDDVLDDGPVPEEVLLDLDDVAGDSGLEAESILAADPLPVGPPDQAEVEVDVVGLEVDPEWPAFAEPLDVQKPGAVDPLVAGGAQPLGDPRDAGLADIVAGDSEFSIVPDEALLGGLPPSDPVADDVVSASSMEGLVDSGLGTLDRVGEPSSPSADQVSGLHDPTGWGPPPDAGSALDESTPVEGRRREDPWGEPLEPDPAEAQPSAPTSDPAKLEALEAARSEATAEALPWAERAATEPSKSDEDVPVAEVTRTRTRTRTKGPRPFLLILFLLLIATVAVLWWAGLLDVPALDFLRGDGT